MPISPHDLSQLDNALTYGLGLMTGFFISGYLHGVTGSFGLFQVSGLIALTGGLLFAAFQVRGRQPGDA